MGADQSLIGQGFAAFLFDMDGTILNSIAAAERIWANWATANGLDPQMVLAAVHGVRAVDTIRRFAPAGTDIEAEAHRITLAEIDDVEGIVEVPGACEFLRALPADRWAVVTSAPRTLALRRMAAGGLPIPDVLVTAEDVQRGKPAHRTASCSAPNASACPSPSVWSGRTRQRASLPHTRPAPA
jgi:sugar-phosphatase